MSSRSRKRAARQAELGEVEESEVAVYTHDPEAAEEVAVELCEALRDMVAFVLQPATVWELQWSVAGFPTIMDLGVLSRDPMFTALPEGLRHQLLDDQSAQTAVERGDGILPAISVKRGTGSTSLGGTVGGCLSGVRRACLFGGEYAQGISGNVAYSGDLGGCTRGGGRSAAHVQDDTDSAYTGDAHGGLRRWHDQEPME